MEMPGCRTPWRCYPAVLRVGVPPHTVPPVQCGGAAVEMSSPWWELVWVGTGLCPLSSQLLPSSPSASPLKVAHLLYGFHPLCLSYVCRRWFNCGFWGKDSWEREQDCRLHLGDSRWKLLHHSGH